MSRFIQGNCVHIMSGFPANAVDFMSGSSGALLRHRPLRTVRAGFLAYGSGLSITPHKSRFHNRKSLTSGSMVTFRVQQY